MTILDDLADYARLRSLHDQETIPYSQMRQTAEALVDGAGSGHFAFEDACGVRVFTLSASARGLPPRKA